MKFFLLRRIYLRWLIRRTFATPNWEPEQLSANASRAWRLVKELGDEAVFFSAIRRSPFKGIRAFHAVGNVDRSDLEIFVLAVADGLPKYDFDYLLEFSYAAARSPSLPSLASVLEATCRSASPPRSLALFILLLGLKERARELCPWIASDGHAHDLVETEASTVAAGLRDAQVQFLEELGAYHANWPVLEVSQPHRVALERLASVDFYEIRSKIERDTVSALERGDQEVSRRIRDAPILAMAFPALDHLSRLG